MKDFNHKIQNVKGFTIIEIVVVMIIIGIIAATIVPKFFGLEDNAANKAVQGVVAELQARANLAFAKGHFEGTPYADRKPSISDFDGEGGRYEIVNRPLPDKAQIITLVCPGRKSLHPIYYTPPKGPDGDKKASPAMFVVHED